MVRERLVGKQSPAFSGTLEAFAARSCCVCVRPLALFIYPPLWLWSAVRLIINPRRASIACAPAWRFELFGAAVTMAQTEGWMTFPTTS